MHCRLPDAEQQLELGIRQGLMVWRGVAAKGFPVNRRPILIVLLDAWKQKHHHLKISDAAMHPKLLARHRFSQKQYKIELHPVDY
jgi:hypothetical protein